VKADFLLGEWAVYVTLNSLARGPETIRIEPNMMHVLAFLAQHKGQVLSKEEIIEKVWPDTFVTTQTLYRCISELRTALGDDGKNPRYIQTIAKGGYRLIDSPAQPEKCKCSRLRRAGLPVPGRVIGSIAVLPFADMTEEKGLGCFCENIAEEIINQLSQVKGLRVVSRGSSFQYRSRTEDPRNVGERLNVCAVLEGNVQREGRSLRVTVQLICAVDNCHIWSERYDFTERGHFAVHDAVANAVARKLLVCSGRAKTGATPKRSAGGN
jgi:TolB-like protein